MSGWAWAALVAGLAAPFDMVPPLALIGDLTGDWLSNLYFASLSPAFEVGAFCGALILLAFCS